MGTTWDVIVIGGGLAGLTAAATAMRAGASTVVLEATRPGGRARTTERDGFVFNLGAHALYLGGEAAEVLHSLGITPIGARPGRYQLRAGGVLHESSPTRTTALGTRSRTALLAFWDRLMTTQPAAHAGQSINAFLDDVDLPSDAAAILRAQIRLSTYASDFDDMSADAAILQLQRGAAKGVLYLDGGWRQLTDALSRNVMIRSHTTVVQVRGEPHAVEVETTDGVIVGRTAIVATGTPASVRTVLATAPAWGGIGQPLTAACLDVAVCDVPSPGYVLGVDEPLFGTTQSPPARQAPDGSSVVAVLRYGARTAAKDRPAMERWLSVLGVAPERVVRRRFLARMDVVGAIPRARSGGLAGRPAVDATAMPNVSVAGDWVGPHGCLSDAAFASGYACGRAAARTAASAPTTLP